MQTEQLLCVHMTILHFTWAKETTLERARVCSAVRKGDSSRKTVCICSSPSEEER